MAGSFLARLFGGSKSKKVVSPGFYPPELGAGPNLDSPPAKVRPDEDVVRTNGAAPRLGGVTDLDRTTIVAFSQREKELEAPRSTLPSQTEKVQESDETHFGTALTEPRIPAEPPSEMRRSGVANLPALSRSAQPTPSPEIADSEDESDDFLPQFRFLGEDLSRPVLQTNRPGTTRAQALQALREAFTPTQPKQTARLFSGRRRELKRIVTAIEEWKAHVVIFGERGYGKSSLANIVSEIAKQAGISVLSCSCSTELTFEEMFRNFLRDIPLPFRGVPGRAEGYRGDPLRNTGNFASLLPTGPFGATDITEALRHLTDRHVIFRIDEFDRVRDPDIKNQIAESIKNLSDVGARITFLIVGVADDLDELLGNHPSIQRNVVGIHLTLMNETELLTLIKAGEKAADITFTEEVRARIVALAQGLPYQTQLLCQQSGQVAIEEGVKKVTPQHLMRAIDQALALAPRAIERSFERAFAGPDHDNLKAVAFASALSPSDPWGFFCVQDVARGQRALSSDALGPETIQSTLENLADQKRDLAILRTRNDRSGRYYAFTDPLLRAYILLRIGREHAIF